MNFSQGNYLYAGHQQIQQGFHFVNQQFYMNQEAFNKSMIKQTNYNQLDTLISKFQYLINKEGFLYPMKAIQTYEKEAIKEFEKLKNQFDFEKVKPINQEKLIKLKVKAIQAQRDNDELVQQIMKIEDIIIKLATNQGRIQTNPQQQSELYRRVTQIKRLLYEIENKFYEIVYHDNVREFQKKQFYVPCSIKELQNGIQVLKVETTKSEQQFKILKNHMLHDKQ